MLLLRVTIGVFCATALDWALLSLINFAWESSEKKFILGKFSDQQAATSKYTSQ